MGQSTYQISDVVDDARTYGELAPILPSGGYVAIPAISIANDTLQNMLSGGPDGQPFNWKWNRMLDPTFFLNSWQQDYFIPNLATCGWLESCTATNFSFTGSPKPVRPVEVKRDLLITNAQTNEIGKICWMQNDTLLSGLWGQSTQLSATGLTNPGPGVVITNPANLTAMPVNPTTCIHDTFGNLWVVTTYGTCGNVNPFLTNLNPVYPSLQVPATVATTVTDGTVVWTAVNPKGQGFRVNPIPGQTGPVWLISPVVQNRVAQYTSLTQYLDPIPDDYYQFFKQGFFAQCYRRSTDKFVRSKYAEEYSTWMRSLANAVRNASREEDDWGFVPSGGASMMDNGSCYFQQTPAYPYSCWGY